jgi:hypothetical protein
MAESFIDCTSLNISYDIMGIATVTYTIVSDEPGFAGVQNELGPYGGRMFRGYVTSASVSQIPYTSWYETHITLVTTTD